MTALGMARLMRLLLAYLRRDTLLSEAETMPFPTVVLLMKEEIRYLPDPLTDSVVTVPHAIIGAPAKNVPPPIRRALRALWRGLIQVLYVLYEVVLTIGIILGSAAVILVTLALGMALIGLLFVAWYKDRSPLWLLAGWGAVMNATLLCTIMRLVSRRVRPSLEHSTF